LKDERAEDPATLASLLRVYGELELEPRLGQLLREALTLAGTTRGWVLTPSEEPGGNASLQAAESGGTEPSLTGALDDLEQWTDAEREFSGEGRFGGVGPLLAFPVRGEAGPAAGLLLISDAPRLSEAARQRVRRLLHLARAAVSPVPEDAGRAGAVILDGTAACYSRRRRTVPAGGLARAPFRAPLSLIFFDMDSRAGEQSAGTLHGQCHLEVSERVH
jgi:hypothetical protein